MKRFSAFALAVVCLVSLVAHAQSSTPSINGAWIGTYTSSHSPSPTKEVLLFDTSGTTVAGAYLSVSQSAGTLLGYQSGTNTYTFLVTQPVNGCPTPALGTLTATLSGSSLQYTFNAANCQGTDTGKGTATPATTAALAAFPGSGTPGANAITGLWNGTYTSTYSTNPTKEKLFFANFGGATTMGIYVSDSAAMGILTGQVSASSFTLSDNDPTPPCPGRAVFQGTQGTNTLQYGFQATDCQGNIDVGTGTATPAK